MSVLTLGLIHHNQPLVSLYTLSSNPYKRYEPFTTTRLGLFKFHVVRFLQRLIYGTKRYQELFPPIDKIQKITNTKQQTIFPVNCAADDLDLGFGESDQIELFNNHHGHHENHHSHSLPQKQQPHHHHHQQHLELPTFDEFLIPSVQTHTHFHHHQLPTYDEDVIQPVTMISSQHHHHQQQQQQQQPVQLTLPGPTTNTVDRTPQLLTTNFYDYFNDFITQNKEEVSTVSSESYISPLDDEILGGIIPLLQSENNETPIQRLLSTSSSDSYHPSFEHDDQQLSTSCTSSNSSIHQHFHEHCFHNEEEEEGKLPIKPVEEIKLKIEPTDDQPRQRKRKLESSSESSPSSPCSNPLSRTTTNSSSSQKSSTSVSTTSSTTTTTTKRLSKKKRNEPPKETTTVTTTTITNNIQVKKTTTTTVDGVTTSLFFCPHPDCNSVFKVKGYLTRHLKKHNANKTFICPFYGQDSKCHPSGGFSRRDTFKTHLKALHFVYPAGTKSLERNFKSGRCGGCFLFFDNNADWLQNHIEAGLCTGVVNYRESLNSLLD